MEKNIFQIKKYTYEILSDLWTDSIQEPIRDVYTGNMIYPKIEFCGTPNSC